MCLDERNTDSRGRPFAPAFTARRTRAWRRSLVDLNAMAAPSLLLGAIPADGDQFAQHVAQIWLAVRRAIAPDLKSSIRYAQRRAHDDQLPRLRQSERSGVRH